MKRKLSQDAWVLIILLLVLMLVGLAVGVRGNRNGGLELIARRTTYSTKPGGMKAMYETLDDLGYPLERHLKPLTSAPADGVLFITDPELSLSEEEWSGVRSWVEKGNLLVVSSGSEIEYPGMEKLRTVTSKPSCPSFLSPNVRSFRVPDNCRISDEEWKFEHGDCFSKPYG